jgi:hypothetical protein
LGYEWLLIGTGLAIASFAPAEFRIHLYSFGAGFFFAYPLFAAGVLLPPRGTGALRGRTLHRGRRVPLRRKLEPLVHRPVYLQ